MSIETSVQGSAKQIGWMRWLPGLSTFRHYRLGWLAHDVAAGIVLATVLVPVGIAYAIASGLPGIYGLYATIVPLLAYALFGPSRILVLGPDSSLAAIILGVVFPLSGGDPGRAVALAAMMAVVSGTVCILAGVGRLGFITELLSKPIRFGYMNGIALTVLVSQLPKFFGFSIDADGPLRRIWALGKEIWHGGANWAAFAIGIGTLAVILLLKNNKRLPGVLIAVIGATAIVDAFDLATRADVSVLGPLPQGLPTFAIPWITAQDLVPILIGGCAVAVVSFADTSVLSRTYAARTRQSVNPNQEMVGLGAANLAAGLFQGFPISSSSSRTPVAEAAGARTQLTGVVGAIAVALLLLLAPNLLHDLPSAALAAVVIASAIGLIEVTDLIRDLSHPAMGILAVDRLFRRGRGFGGNPGDRACDRDRDHRVPLGRVAAALRGLGARGRPQGLPRHHALSARPPDPRFDPIPLGRTFVFCQCRTVQGARSRGDRDLADPRALVCGRGRTGHQCRCHRGRYALGIGQLAAGLRHRVVLRRAQRSGQGQAQALWPVRTDRRRFLFPDRRRRGQQLSREASDRLGRLGRPSCIEPAG
jgi:hypothetical protein